MAVRQALACLLIALLAVPSPSYPSPRSEPKAAPETPAIAVGVFVGGRAVLVNNGGLAPGTTLFSGDTIAVAAKGGAWLSLERGGQLRLGEQSEARLHRSDERVQVEVLSGRVLFGASENTPVEVWLGDARIRATGAGAAAGAVTMRGPSKAVISAEQGFLRVYTEHDEKSVTLRAGEAVEVTLTETQAATQVMTPEEKKKKKRSGGVWLSGHKVAILTVVMIGSTFLAGWAVPNETNVTNPRNLVSPFAFP